MKNRKTVVVAFLLVAAMLLSVGYAALTDTLFINGTMSVGTADTEDVFDNDIQFSAVTPKSGTNYTASIGGTGDDLNDIGTITINDGSFTTVGSKVVVTYTITNTGDLDATIAVPTLTAEDGTSEFDDEYFTVVTNWDSAMALGAGESITVEVTITLEKTPAAAVTGNFKLTFDAEVA